MKFAKQYPFLESKFYNKELNSKFWTAGEFDSGVREKLLRICEDFIGGTDIGTITDIQLTGSLANYNYTEYSDLDVHILSDFTDVNDDVDLVKRALDGKRFIWNLRHSIVIRSYEVELYFQDTNEPHIASGLFSLLHDEWITVPKYDPPEIDPRDVDKKADGISDIIDRLAEKVGTGIDPEEAETYYENGIHLKDKIRKMRSAGLKREGEFSVENLAFKALRNGGSIGKLIDTITSAYNKIYSEQVVPSIKCNLTFDELAGPLHEDDYLGKLLGLINAQPNTSEKPDPTDKFRKDGTPRARHMKGMTGLTRKTGQNLIPDIYKDDPELNKKVEILRKKNRGRFVLTDIDVKEISDLYNLVGLNGNITKEEPFFLKKTGMFIYFDPNLSRFCIEK